MFNFCNDSSQKWVIVLSAHTVKEFPLSLVLHSCATLEPDLAAIISARDGEIRDDRFFFFHEGLAYFGDGYQTPPDPRRVVSDSSSLSDGQEQSLKSNSADFQSAS